MVGTSRTLASALNEPCLPSTLIYCVPTRPSSARGCSLTDVPLRMTARYVTRKFALATRRLRSAGRAESTSITIVSSSGKRELRRVRSRLVRYVARNGWSTVLSSNFSLPHVAKSHLQSMSNGCIADISHLRTMKALGASSMLTLSACLLRTGSSATPFLKLMSKSAPSMRAVLLGSSSHSCMRTRRVHVA